jgi:hypothetical protein
LEDELYKLDQKDLKDEPYRLCSRRYDDADPTTSKRKELLNEIDTKLERFDELMLREHAFLSLKRPSKTVHKAYFDYIWNEKPVIKDEYQFIYHREDIVILGQHDDSWLGSPIEGLGRFVPRRLLQVRLSSYTVPNSCSNIANSLSCPQATIKLEPTVIPLSNSTQTSERRSY